MDVLTTVWGWFGGKKKGVIPPTPTGIVRSVLTISDFSMQLADVSEHVLNPISIDDDYVTTVIVRDA